MIVPPFREPPRFSTWKGLAPCLLVVLLASPLWAEGGDGRGAQLDTWGILQAGGTIGWMIIALSVAMVALMVEHLLNFRRSVLMPAGLAEEVHGLIGQQQFAAADTKCREKPCYLANVLRAGLAEVPLGYEAVVKGMEDASQVQAARLYRKIEFLTLIGTIAPMLGLLGTVWGMIIAFMEFETQANPQVSQLAPGIYRALVTTFFGLTVAIPAMAGFVFFRNRLDELIADASLLAEHVFHDFKVTLATRKKQERQATRKSVEETSEKPDQPRPPIPPIAIERRRP